jgi:hypothetical protein
MIIESAVEEIPGKSSAPGNLGYALGPVQPE